MLRFFNSWTTRALAFMKIVGTSMRSVFMPLQHASSATTSCIPEHLSICGLSTDGHNIVVMLCQSSHKFWMWRTGSPCWTILDSLRSEGCQEFLVWKSRIEGQVVLPPLAFGLASH